MFGLTNLISPSVALDMLRQAIEKNLGRKISTYQLIYSKEHQNIDFLVPDENGIDKRYKYDNSEMLCKAIENAVSDKSKGLDVTHVILDYKKDGEKSYTLFYITKDGTKEYIKENI